MKIGRYLFGVLCIMFILITFGNRGVVDNYLMGKKLSHLNLENIDLEKQNRELKGKIILLRSDYNYIESIARVELGMVKENDVVYRLTK